MAEVRVLVVDDEVAFREVLGQALSKEGFTVDTAGDGVEALEAFRRSIPDLVLLDVMLPRLTGIDVCREIRATSDVPVIMVSARSEEIDTVVALEVGADDYITKPYRLRELVARIRTVLRRRATGGGAAVNGEVVGELGDGSPDLVVGNLALDRDRHELRVGGQPLDLPLKEFRVLAELMANVGRVVTRDELINRVWGIDYVGDTKTLDVHIKRLRTKLEIDPTNPELIVTIRGLGYKMIGPAT